MTQPAPFSRPMSRARFLRLLAASGLVYATGCTASSDDDRDSRAGRRGGTLVLARNQDVVSLDPAQAGDNGSIFVLYNVVDTLVTINDDSTGVRPSLATEWTVSQDGTRYAFRLRENVRFSDGTPMTARDAVFSLNRARADGAAYGFLFSTISEVREAGSSGVEIVLTEPFPPLLENLSLFAAGIVSEAAVRRDGEAFATNPIATGPFRVESTRRGDRTVLVRNDHYWKPGRPYLDRVEFPVVDSDDARMRALRTGGAHAAEAVPLASAEELRRGGTGTSVAVEPVFGLSVVYLNHTSTLIANRDVRVALNLSADREAILQGAYFGVGEIANSTVPRMRGWSADIERYPLDRERARSLVAGAGVAGARLPLVVSGGDSVAVATAQILEQGWRAAGLDVQIEKVDFATLVERYTTQDYVALLAFETADVTSPWQMPLLHYGANSPNKGMYTSFTDGTLAELVHRGSRLTEISAQNEVLRQVQAVSMDAAPVVPLMFLSSDRKSVV